MVSLMVPTTFQRGLGLRALNEVGCGPPEQHGQRVAVVSAQALGSKTLRQPGVDGRHFAARRANAFVGRYLGEQHARQLTQFGLEKLRPALGAEPVLVEHVHRREQVVLGVVIGDLSDHPQHFAELSGREWAPSCVTARVHRRSSSACGGSDRL